MATTKQKAKKAKRAKQAKQATGTPRNIQQGTSYSAADTALLQRPSGSDAESGSSRGVRVPELVPELASNYQRLVTYNQMMNDSGCDVSIRATKTPVLGADFYVEACSSSPQDKDIADFVCANLFEGLHQPFLSCIEDILHFCEDGYSVVEKVYENREWSPNGSGRNGKVFTMLKSFAYRPASTLLEPTYDNNGYVKSIDQNAIQADNSVSKKTLDANKLLVFTLGRKGGDITGKSLLRTAYPHWYYKTHMYKVDAIQKERHALGVPHGKLLPGYNNADKEALRQMLRNLRANEESFALTTPNIELEFLEIKGQLVDVLKSADHHNMMIMLNVLAVFMALGSSDTGGGGSRAVGATQSDIFMKSLRYLANIICDTINMHCIPELVVWNFPTRNFPKLKVRNIGETQDLQKLASALSNLYSQQVITPDGDNTENWVRDVFDMPKRDDSYVAPVVPLNPGGASPQNTPGGDGVQQSQSGSQGNGKGSTTVAARDQGGGNNPKSANGAAY